MAETIILSGHHDEFSKRYGAYLQSGNINFLLGSGASMPAIQVAGNIEEEINELIAAGETDDADSRALSFIEDIDQKNAAISIGIEYHGTEESLSRYVEFLTAVDHVLFERKNLLLPRQANVFTTNYDSFIEEAARKLSSLILNDGFDRSSSLSSAFPFAPERYFDRTYRSGSIYTRQAEVPTVNLIKLHGSLTWKKHVTSIVFRQKFPAKLTDEQKADPPTVAEALRERALILPNLQKFNSTLMDRVYYDLLRIFANAMDRENAVLISFGFSFADEHILDITRRALRNPTAQLIYFAYNSDAADDVSDKFAAQRNALIVAPVEGEVIDFHKFNSVVQRVTRENADAND